ncbi:MAG TPA: DNA-binding domain-containing protein [Vicinamibacteria bacterium]
MAEVALDRLQRWMQEVVVHPGAVGDGLAAEQAAALVPPAALESVILPSASLTAAERVGVYHGMYLLRMEEALATDYPGLKHLLGDDGFFALVRGYVQRHPSRHFSLNRLGDHLPEFVAGAPLRRRDFCADLARLELALSQAFDAEESPVLGEAEVAAVRPQEWERARLVPVASLRLLALRYPAPAYLDSLDDAAHRHPPLRKKAAYVAVYRRDYRVFRLALAKPAHALLADLAAGMPLGAAVAAALVRPSRPRPGEDELFRWFRQWVAHGLFARVAAGD